MGGPESKTIRDEAPRIPLDDDNDALTLRVYADRYVIERELARGGMGRVFVARDQRLSRAVALKLLAPGQHDETQLRRFQDEARAAGSLNHPNVLVVHDAGEHEGEPYIIEELLDGETLRERLKKGPCLSADAVALALQIAHGLAAAHERGIVHRDLKPENLFLTQRRGARKRGPEGWDRRTRIREQGIELPVEAIFAIAK
jgi:serine/threonine protein kinase